MQVFSFSLFWTIVIDIAAWAFFHLAISALCLRLPLATFQNEAFWSRIYPWEKSGALWDRLFRVKAWKGRLIDGASLFRSGYQKKTLHGTGREDLQTFAEETERAELTHWLSILPAPLFFLWNPPMVGWLMIVYAVVFNLPFIITQRYNRGRIKKMLS
ncbi:glycosyl-4,4'-diaponeurosporenoate acyltransferase [Salinicoccus sp. ID82-1]|uniref:glycosyl-4,4'-diaponeurosporenoate acyltransferase CrtO family protein n=1 Tax=Salinicoccus sp. ID82-1 TaxID=2820269 RepID=UPI001F1D165F|nr:glycosyl-4,4'-diaponeurosporenoate acyltransferase [Salinicoccus sp. ID82-1]MCG1009714.1 glycosyl-4,4'-diaponeurosporenoate acyltransferase [Salinicoccus sp. ID82-1]